MLEVKLGISHLRSSFGARPFIPKAAEAESASDSANVGRESAAHARAPPVDGQPLKLGPMGPLANSNGRVFDNKIACQADFQLSGHKGGDQWKGKTERYMISVVPAMHAILQWAERRTEPITQELFEKVVGEQLTTWDNNGAEHNHAYALNGAVWGFLSNCLSGEAQTFFKKADTLMGFEAWRRIARFLDHGRDIRLGISRNEVRTIRGQFLITSLEEVVAGMAKFENHIGEIVSAGGVPTTRK